MKEKFTAKNISLFLGLLGYALLFIIFAFTCCSFNEQDYTLYSLFFTIDSYSLFPMGGPIFFIVFMMNFLLYLSLLVIRLLKKDTIRTKFLGAVGIVINALNLIALFALLSFDDMSDLILIVITFELIGFFVMYGTWIYACKNREAEENGCIDKKQYIIYSLGELIFFLLPLAIVIGFLLLTGSGSLGKGKTTTQCKKGKTTTQFKFNKDDNTIMVGDVKYLVKGNEIFDIKTDKIVGHLEKDKVIFDIKSD